MLTFNSKLIRTDRTEKNLLKTFGKIDEIQNNTELDPDYRSSELSRLQTSIERKVAKVRRERGELSPNFWNQYYKFLEGAAV